MSFKLLDNVSANTVGAVQEIVLGQSINIGISGDLGGGTVTIGLCDTPDGVFMTPKYDGVDFAVTGTTVASVYNICMVGGKTWVRATLSGATDPENVRVILF